MLVLQLAGTTHEYFLTGVAVPFLFRPAPSVGVRIERLLDVHFRDRWARPALRPGPPLPHLRRDCAGDCAHVHHVRAGTGPAPATSASGPVLSRTNLDRESASGPLSTLPYPESSYALGRARAPNP